jgi:hypothetical protein
MIGITLSSFAVKRFDLKLGMVWGKIVSAENLSGDFKKH